MPKETHDEIKIVTKKHMARQEKESRQNRILLIGIIVILAAVILIPLYGWFSNTVLQSSKPVAKVDGTTISVEQFKKRVQYERLSLTQSYMNYALSQFATYFQTQLKSVQDQLDNYVQFGSDTLDQMITEVVIAHKAAELGITVSEEEINLEIERNFGFFPNGTPTPAPTEQVYPTSTLSSTQLALITATPIPTESPTAIPPTATATIEVTPGITGTQELPTATASPVAATSTPTEIPTVATIEPTPTQYTREGFNGLYATMVAGVGEQTSFTDADFHDYVRNILLGTKLYNEVTKDVSAEQEMVWARHILVKTEPEAKLILTMLSEGQDWAALAEKSSTDTSNNKTGGDLGWFSKGQMVAEFETAAFALKIGEISEPVKTEFGYHIIQVLGHEVRRLDADQLNTVKGQAYSKYIEAAKAAYKIKKYDIWASVAPSTPTIPAEYRIQ
jgi:peptidyl-prolyl cis-trans isomerase D